MAQIVAHDANSGLILFDGDLGTFSQSLANFGDPRRVVYGQRNTDFRTGQHVHGGCRAAEKLEDAMEKSVGHEHARGADIYDVNPALAGNGFDDAGTRSEEHTSELQSHLNLVCRLLLEKKKQY